MDFYERMAATAGRLLSRYGACVTLPRFSGGSIDPVSGDETVGSMTNKKTVGLLKPYPDSLIDGVRIQNTDKMLILASTIEPLMDDTPKMNGETLGNILSIKSVNPAGTAVVYFCQVRK